MADLIRSAAQQGHSTFRDVPPLHCLTILKVCLGGICLWFGTWFPVLRTKDCGHFYMKQTLPGSGVCDLGGPVVEDKGVCHFAALVDNQTLKMKRWNLQQPALEEHVWHQEKIRFGDSGFASWFLEVCFTLPQIREPQAQLTSFNIELRKNIWLCGVQAPNTSTA